MGRESVFRSDRHARAQGAFPFGAPTFDTFEVLVTVVGTFSVSKFVVMDTVCIGGDGSRV